MGPRRSARRREWAVFSPARRPFSYRSPGPLSGEKTDPPASKRRGARRLSKKFDSLLRDTKRTTRAMRGGCLLVSPSTLFRRKNTRFCALRTQNRVFFLSRCQDSRYMPGNPDVILIFLSSRERFIDKLTKRPLCENTAVFLFCFQFRHLSY